MLNSKKIASLGLALAMAATMAVPAFADDAANSTVMEGTYTEPEISVTVPAKGTVSVNPYGLPVKVESSSASVTIKNMQLVSAPMTLRNNGEVSLDAYVTASTVIPDTSHVTFVAANPNDNDTAKKTPSIYMQLEAAASAKSGSGDSLEKGLIEEFGADDTWTGATAVDFDTTGAIGTKTKLVTLKEVDSSKKYQAGSIAQVRLNGKVSEDPETTPWATTDTFTTTIAFTFKCTPVTASSDSSEEQGTGAEEQGTGAEEQGTGAEEQGTGADGTD
jgi:hypothetical protein